MARREISAIEFAPVYPMYVAKAERKGRTKAEVDEVIRWLTGYTDADIAHQIDERVDFGTFISQAPELNPARSQITGVICGVRVENIEDPMTQEIRYLDKLIDELARGKAMEKILRSPAAE